MLDYISRWIFTLKNQEKKIEMTAQGVKQLIFILKMSCTFQFIIRKLMQIALVHE